MQDDGVMRRFIGFLSILTLLAAITLNVVSLSLPNWLQFEVDRSTLSNRTGLDYFTRSRGAFLTCLSNTSAPPLSASAYSSQVKFGSCFDVDLGGNLNNTDASYLGTGADTILVLRKLHIGLHLASGAVLCVSLLVCLYILASTSEMSGLVAPTGLSLLAAGLQFGAHIAFNNTLMRELLPPISGTTAVASAGLSIYNALPSNLQLATKVTPGASYYIALAAFSACLAAAGTSLVGLALPNQRQRQQRGEPSDKFDEFGSPYTPTGSAAKAGNGEQAYQMQRYPVEQPDARFDAGNNWSGGGGVGGGGRLPRIPVTNSYEGF
ncbi:hypothetical protein BOX15_Mlig004874g1 [Macrostomum lignano]|uniref:Uncharacterized protein n=1 Tax=Macrostomum lignano TaxID=282301 RepID=A0A267DZ13_9PLAT|nr:hypothetical protein BOX15_Mlig004874g1 [Macrostomum lignano]